MSKMMMEPTLEIEAPEKAKVAVQVVQRWIIARIRGEALFAIGALIKCIADLPTVVNDRPMRRVVRRNNLRFLRRRYQPF